MILKRKTTQPPPQLVYQKKLTNIDAFFYKKKTRSGFLFVSDIITKTKINKRKRRGPANCGESCNGVRGLSQASHDRRHRTGNCWTWGEGRAFWEWSQAG